MASIIDLQISAPLMTGDSPMPVIPSSVEISTNTATNGASPNVKIEVAVTLVKGTATTVALRSVILKGKSTQRRHLLYLRPSSALTRIGILLVRRSVPTYLII